MSPGAVGPGFQYYAMLADDDAAFEEPVHDNGLSHRRSTAGRESIDRQSIFNIARRQRSQDGNGQGRDGRECEHDRPRGPDEDEDLNNDDFSMAVDSFIEYRKVVSLQSNKWPSLFRKQSSLSS